jgi:hypothetical protein
MLALSRPSRLLGVALAAALLSVAVLAAAAQAQTTGTAVPPPASFTSTFSVSSDGGMVPGGGTSGATGVFNLQLDSTTNTICHDITISNVTPPFESPAPTATHIHMGAPGEAGPAVWLFNDPQPRSDGSLRSTGCLREAFTSDGQGLGFTVADIEANPAAFYVDNHTTANPSGSVRGQFPGAAAPVGGVAAGGGGLAAASTGGVDALVLATALGLALVGGAAVTARRRVAA